MATAMRMTIVVAAVALMLVQCVTSTTLTVGDATGWTSALSSPDFYSTWAAEQSFAVGDILEFKFATGLHTVVQVTSKDAYESCDATLEADATILKSTAKVTLDKEGTYYFFCTIGNHCGKGQKLSVIVPSTATAPATATAAADTPNASPSPVSPPMSEDHSSALRISGFSVLFVPIVMSFMVLARVIT